MIVVGLQPDVYTYTFLEHGSCNVGNLAMAKSYFDEMLGRVLQPDCCAYTARIIGEMRLGSLHGLSSCGRK